MLDVFGRGPHRFDAPRTVIGCDRSALDLPLPQANPQTQRMCEEQCRLLLMRRKARAGRTEQVRDLLLHDPQNIPDIGQVCRHFGIIERTLRRQLEAEGTSYNELVDKVRRFLANELLRAGLSVESVGERLGFSEAASLIRAYKRWTGITPGSFRRAARG